MCDSWWLWHSNGFRFFCDHDFLWRCWLYIAQPSTSEKNPDASLSVSEHGSEVCRTGVTGPRSCGSFPWSDELVKSVNILDQLTPAISSSMRTGCIGSWKKMVCLEMAEVWKPDKLPAMCLVVWCESAPANILCIYIYIYIYVLCVYIIYIMCIYIYCVYIYTYIMYIYICIIIYICLLCVYIYILCIYMYIDNYWLYKNYVVYRNCWILIKKQHDCPVFFLLDQCVFHDALTRYRIWTAQSRLRCWNRIIQQRLKTLSELQRMSDGFVWK